MDEERFCPKCTGLLEPTLVEGKRRPVCSKCGKIIFYDPKLATASVVAAKGRVLLVRRSIEPGMGLWSFPGGYVDRGEMVEKAAQREMLEETGLHIRIIGLLGLFSEPDNPVVLAAYTGEVTAGSPKPGPEVMELGFFDPDQLPPLAFPRDRQVIAAWLRTLTDSPVTSRSLDL